jgi:hypothetical protein
MVSNHGRRSSVAGFKSKKIFCSGVSKLSGKNCQAKGFPTNKFNKHGIQIYKCRFHGAQNTNFYGFRDRANRGGFNKLGYTDDKKIKSLASLKQFRDKDLDYVRNYYYEKVKPRVDSLGRYSSKYSIRAIKRRKNSCKYKEGRNITDQLDQVLSVLEARGKQGNQNQD